MIDKKTHYHICSRFWNGEKDGKLLSLQGAEGRSVCIDRAIRDLMARTLDPIKGTEGDFSKEIQKVLLNRLSIWFDHRHRLDQHVFDKWHRKSCDHVLQVLRKYYKNQNGSQVDYGKAQKIVNMTMKGLYCLQDAYEKEAWFLHCHIALDSFTLEWFKRNVMPAHEDARKKLDQLLNCWKKDPDIFRECQDQQGDPGIRQLIGGWDENIPLLRDRLNGYDALLEQRKKREANKFWRCFLDETHKLWLPKKLKTGSIPSWSAISLSGAGSKYGYDQLVGWIRGYFSLLQEQERTYGNLTPFQAEFYIWPSIQLEMAAENLYGQDIGKAAVVSGCGISWTEQEAGDINKQFDRCKQEYSDLPLKEKIALLKARIDILSEAIADYE